MKTAWRSFWYFLLMVGAAKLMFLVGFIYQEEIQSLFKVKVAVADTAAKSAAATASDKVPADMAKEQPKDPLGAERALLTLLTAKKKELEEREARLKVEEERLAAIRKDIEEMIHKSRQQEEKLKALIDQINAFEAKAIKDLAKIYENTPPAKAGVMLEKLDSRTAAGLTLNMKRDKAGAIWAFISPQKAAEITKDITSITVKR